MKIAVVILAGGEGRRIGGNKPLRLLGGRSLLDRALSHAKNWSDAVAVAVRGPAQLGQLTAPVVRDAPEAEGPLGGLASALQFAVSRNCNAALTIPADMPFLPSNLTARLIEAIGDRRAAIAESGGRLHPVCGLWKVEALDVLPAYLAAGTRSLKGFGEAIGMTSVAWLSQPIDPFFNINSEDDLVEAAQICIRNPGL